MSTPQLTYTESFGVAFLTDPAVPEGVRFGFTERKGGVSEGAWVSLNLGDSCGDDPAAVAENRRRALRALGFAGDASRLVNPKQVHGDEVLLVESAEAEALAAAQKRAREGADAVVCTVGGVPVLLCFADCVPVVLVARGGFAVVHSGWRGTLARISAKALRVLTDATGQSPDAVRAYIGPHIAGPDYEVSEELLGRFVAAFGPSVALPERHLDLACAIRCALVEAGMQESSIAESGISTMQAHERFYSYRASGGHTGRLGALAYIAQ